jgi:type IV pilus assembly protein PilW
MMIQAQKAFSLVEFMISITIGSILTLGIIGVYNSSKKNYVVQEALARLQENGRYTTYYINKHLRMAGYQGCINSNNLTLNNIVKNPTTQVSFDMPLSGYHGGDGSWTPALPANLTAANIKPGTDVIEIRYATDLGVRLAQAMANSNSAMVLDDPDGDGDEREGIAQNDIIMITDCETGDIAAAGGNENANSISISASNNNTTSLSKAYDTDVKILRYNYIAIYVKDSGRTNTSGEPIFSLASQDINGNESILADGVEDLKVSYGVDTTGDGSADSFLSAQQITNNNQWGDVLNVRVEQLLNSVESVSTEGQSYEFDGATLDADDRLLRRQWHSVISVRNRNFP